MYKEVVFNGKYMWLKEKRGVHRYTQEVLKALDKQIPKGAVKVIIPHHCAQKDTFENIEVIEYGGKNNSLLVAVPRVPVICVDSQGFLCMPVLLFSFRHGHICAA